MKVDKNISNEKIQRLNEKKRNLSKIQKKENDVINFISTLNSNLSQPTMVTISDNLAYLPGKIINTNECKIYIGEDFFVETTNSRAIKILKSRKSKVDKLIEDVEKDLQSLGGEIKENIDIKETIEYNEPKSFDPNSTLNKLNDDTFEIVEKIDDKNLETGNKFNIVIEDDRNIIEEKLKQLIASKKDSNQEVLDTLERKPLDKKNIQNKKKKDVILTKHINTPEEDNDTQNHKRSLFFEDQDI